MSHFSTLDLKSAYHQILLNETDRKFTAFEANGKFYQSRVLAFGLTDAVASFQRIMDDMISSNHLQAITVCGTTQADHDANLKAFMNVAGRLNLTFNKEKCCLNTRSVRMLGYLVARDSTKPDPDRLQPLLDMPVPTDGKSLKRALGLFAYYAKWISHFSDKIRPLNVSQTFPIHQIAVDAFRRLIADIANASLRGIDPSLPLTVETDASATLNQNGRRIAFYHRTLNISERKHSSVEKEAYAIVGSIKKWEHLLRGRHFTLITDQRSVSSMLNQTHPGKIKNDKIQRWRLELSPFKFSITYRPGSENASADALSI